MTRAPRLSGVPSRWVSLRSTHPTHYALSTHSYMNPPYVPDKAVGWAKARVLGAIRLGKIVRAPCPRGSDAASNSDCMRAMSRVGTALRRTVGERRTLWPAPLPTLRAGQSRARSMRLQLGRSGARHFHGGDPVLHRLLHLLEGAHLDLAHALARDAELVGELLERDRVVDQPARLEDATLALIEHGERLAERLAAVVGLLVLGEPGLLAGALVDQPVLPFAGIAFLADRGVERDIAAEPAVHVDHVLLGDAETLGDELDLVGPQVALFQRRDLALGLAQVEEQLLLVGGGAHLHQRPRAQDVFLDRGLDPPHGVGGETEPLVGLEALDRLHQGDIALRDHLGNRQAVAAVAHGDLGDQAQMAGDQLVRRVAVAMLAPALGQHEFFLRLQHWEPPDLFEISG